MLNFASVFFIFNLSKTIIMKVKRVLISQPKPEENSSSPYLNIGKNITVDFKSFVHVESLPPKEIREQKIELGKYSAIIITSKNAIDYFFDYAEKCRYKVPDALKFFCISEAIANYLQNYITYRKRKIYFGQKTITDLIPYLKKHKKEHHFLLPCSNKISSKTEEFLRELDLRWKRINLYQTVISNLSDLKVMILMIYWFFSAQLE